MRPKKKKQWSQWKTAWSCKIKASHEGWENNKKKPKQLTWQPRNTIKCQKVISNHILKTWGSIQGSTYLSKEPYINFKVWATSSIIFLSWGRGTLKRSKNSSVHL